MGIAGDNVDPEMVRQPHRWSMKLIRNFTIVFGVVSSAFDYGATCNRLRHKSRLQ